MAQLIQNLSAMPNGSGVTACLAVFSADDDRDALLADGYVTEQWVKDYVGRMSVKQEDGTAAPVTGLPCLFVSQLSAGAGGIAWDLLYLDSNDDTLKTRGGRFRLQV